MDGTGTKQDGKQAESPATPSAATQETPKAPPTFTEDQVKKAVSDALAKAGREAKSLSEKETAIAAREKAISEAEARRETEERERLKDKPEELTIYDRKRQMDAEAKRIAEEKKAIEADKASHQAELDEAKALKHEMAVFNLATELNVDANTLKDTGIADLEQLKKVGAMLPKKSVSVQVDSGKTAGGSTLTSEMISKMSPDERYARRAEIEKIPII